MVRSRVSRWWRQRWWFRGVVVLFLLLSTMGIGESLLRFAPSAWVAPLVCAQEEIIYIPETGHTLRGAFLHFWRSNGGPLGNIYTFGYPITEEYRDPVSGRLVQYFERARFEWVEPLNVVQLGDLGREITAGRTYPTVAPIRETAQRRYIPQTQHIIQYGFKEIWETHGAERIFGWPISEEIQEVASDGKVRTVQYFTKARFEFWPERPPGLRVIITPLGRILAPPQLTAPVPPPGASQQPPPSPEPAPPQSPPALVAPPANENATVTPERGLIGIDVNFHAIGFQPNELVSVWLHRIPMGNEAAGADIPVAEKLKVNDRGQLEKPVVIKTRALSPGIWRIVAQGWESQYQAKGHIVLEARSGTAAQAAPSAPSGMPPNEHAVVVPERGPVGTEVSFHAVGFRKNERVSVWLHRVPMANEAPGTDIPVAQRLKTDDLGQLERPILIKTNNLSPGVWRIVAQGLRSKHQAKGHILLETGGNTTPAPNFAPTPNPSAPSATPPGSAIVTNVVDGDTVDVALNGQNFRIRLLGIDTPERGQCYSDESTAKTREWLLGKTVSLEADASQGDTDQHGRLLRYIWLPEGRLVNFDGDGDGIGCET